MKIVILGLSVTSSWGNGHATTYRSLIRGLAARGHDVLFLERDTPWYAGNRDEPHPFGARTELYQETTELMSQFERDVREADLVIVGSFVPEGARIGRWVTSVAKGVTAFYDIDTPVTLSKLTSGGADYITADLIPAYGIYFSFTGGPMLRHIETTYGARMARPLYCSVDTTLYSPRTQKRRWDLGYLGTYSQDRQPALDELLLKPASQWRGGRFAVVGPMYPESLKWPANVDREIHLSPREHPDFYAAQRFTLNVTRAAMKTAGYSPSVRLFEAGACACPVISDCWEGLDSLFEIGREILICTSAEHMQRLLRDTGELECRSIGDAARRRVLQEHTPEKRAAELEACIREYHDNFSSGQAWTDGRGGPSHGRMVAGMASQLSGAAAGGTAGGENAPLPNPGGIRQSTGTNG